MSQLILKRLVFQLEILYLKMQFLHKFPKFSKILLQISQLPTLEHCICLGLITSQCRILGITSQR